MDEHNWRNATDPHTMLAFVLGTGVVSERKLRLFGVACCRLVWELLPDEPCRSAVAVAERFADGQATEDELVGARTPLLAVVNSHAAGPLRTAAGAVAETMRPPGKFRADLVAWGPAHVYGLCLVGHDTWRHWDAWVQARDAKLAETASILRELFSDPFHPPTLDLAWLAWSDSTVKKLAQAAYEHRSLLDGTLDRNRVAVLADALEEAGCTDEMILGHLRGPGPHVRGCWPIDLLLGKS